jgi:hypothetical protein
MRENKVRYSLNVLNPSELLPHLLNASAPDYPVYNLVGSFIRRPRTALHFLPLQPILRYATVVIVLDWKTLGRCTPVAYLDRA